MEEQKPDLRRYLWVIPAAVLLAVGIFLANRDNAPSGPDRTGQIQVSLPWGTEWLDLLEGLAPSRLKPEHFAPGDRGRIDYTGPLEVLRGIDVSAHQGAIDWARVAADGVDFALIRAGYRGYTEGGLFTDSAFERNLTEAQQNGVAVGAYFFSQAVSAAEAEEEADYLLRLLDGRPIAGPLVFDWEIIGDAAARTDGLDRDTLTEAALAFCKKVAAAGYRPVVYFNQEVGYLRLDLSRLQDYGFWLAEYKSHPSFYYDIHLWQYSSTGKVAGIEGDVDLDLCFGDYFSVG